MQMDWTTLKKSAPFPAEAFQFVREGLAHTVKMVHGEAGAATEDESRHVSGRQLCVGLKDYAQRQYGLLARAVLERWGITRTADFGRIVFAMIDSGLMRRTDEDTIEDFHGVYDFDEAFGSELRRRGSRVVRGAEASGLAPEMAPGVAPKLASGRSAEVSPGPGGSATG